LGRQNEHCSRNEESGSDFNFGKCLCDIDIQNKIPAKMLDAIILLFAVLFSLNTIGNLFAKSKFELYFFTPLTFILAVLCLRIVMNKSQNK
jgi:hypothetical protein